MQTFESAMLIPTKWIFKSFVLLETNRQRGSKFHKDSILARFNYAGFEDVCYREFSYQFTLTKIFDRKRNSDQIEFSYPGFQARDADAKNLFEVLLFSPDERFHQFINCFALIFKL